jgi:class 3 adenylate cyclase
VDEMNLAMTSTGRSAKIHMQSLYPTPHQMSVFGSEPIADLFPSATVIFTDIADFTAWCSERDPSQAFALLENLYHAFDEVGEKLGIFKVETIGDSYVAVAGLPQLRKDHAVIMSRFAASCIRRMDKLVKDLEILIGPSTEDLQVRVGLHSGPVTAGVLRGAKARFQLFGDTVNTASRLEASGAPSRIHASLETVQLLRKAKKDHWITERADVVHIKGKGLLPTFWIQPRKLYNCSADKRDATAISFSDVVECKVASDSVCLSSESSFPHPRTKKANLITEKQERNQRLVNWNVETLYSLLEQVVASRGSPANVESLSIIEKKWNSEQVSGRIVLDEMTDILSLPDFIVREKHNHAQSVGIDACVKEQLRDFVSFIASLYQDVPFHNFEHASHVIMSAGKLMKRILQPEGIVFEEDMPHNESLAVRVARQVHYVTYGISSDPLMHFAVVFSALIHDVDHTGLTNKELVDMKAPVAVVYREKCVAEQNSVDLAWHVLMDDKYRNLRACIYSTEHELKRFRELLVDAVMATDIADKELQTLRKCRWADAFHKELTPGAIDKLDMDRKATIVFEHIIQASDVSHCMQHWHTYQKFNARLFEERYVAYLNGVAGDKPPWVGWYNGEIWFFDNYIIPLAQKLNDCGVFGVSYHEYLNYAQQNRLEWERKGEEVVSELQSVLEAKYKDMIFDQSSLVLSSKKVDL